MRVIPVTEGASEYVWAALRETGGLDISADTVSVALGTYTSPGQWVTPADLQHPTSSTARAAYQVNSSTPPGRCIRPSVDTFHLLDHVRQLTPLSILVLNVLVMRTRQHCLKPRVLAAGFAPVCPVAGYEIFHRHIGARRHMLGDFVAVEDAPAAPVASQAGQDHLSHEVIGAVLVTHGCLRASRCPSTYTSAYRPTRSSR
jgi:hypothetical protein